jgi:hypothetical protein
VGEDLILAMVYDRQVQKSRIGLVWLYTRRTIHELLEILASADATASEQALDDDFGTSLMAELDTIFVEDGAASEGDFAAFAFPDEDSPPAEPAQPVSGDPPPSERPVDAAFPEGHTPPAGTEELSSADEPSGSSPGQGPKKNGGGSGRRLFNLEQAIEEGLLPPDFCL